MTERERWTVYPLLLLTLGIALRSKITQSLDLHEIKCRTLDCEQLLIKGPNDTICLALRMLPSGAGGGGQLLIQTSEGKPAVVLRATPQGGLIEAAGPGGLPQAALQGTATGGVLETFSAQGVPQVVVQSTPRGGAVNTVDHEGKLNLQFGIGVEQRRIRLGPLPPIQQPDPPESDDAPAHRSPPAHPPEDPPQAPPDEPADRQPAGAAVEP